MPTQPQDMPRYRIVYGESVVRLWRWNDMRELYELVAQMKRCIWDELIASALLGELARRREGVDRRKLNNKAAVDLERHEGKEAILLFWVAERTSEPDVLRRSIVNWRGLSPEERWWLVTQAMATEGRPEYAPDRGWRQAIFIALTEA